MHLRHVTYTAMLAFLVSACACPNSYVVKPIQKSDKQLSCKDIVLEINEVEFLKKQSEADKAFELRDALFPVCYAPSYLSAAKAVRAADERLHYLQEIYSLSDCDRKLSASRPPSESYIIPPGARQGYRAVPPPGARPLPPGARPLPPGVRPPARSATQLPPGVQPYPRSAQPAYQVPSNKPPQIIKPAPRVTKQKTTGTKKEASQPNNKIKLPWLQEPKVVRPPARVPSSSNSSVQQKLNKGLPSLPPLPTFDKNAKMSYPPLQGYVPPSRYGNAKPIPLTKDTKN